MNKFETIEKSDFIVSLGTMLSNHKELFNSIKSDAQLIYMHPIDNKDLKNRYEQFIKYEVGSEEGILSMLLSTFVKSSNEKIQVYIEDLDLGYICAESSAGEEEFEEVYEKSLDCAYKTLIVGEDLIDHERIENIIKFLAIIKKYSDFNIVILDENLEKRVDTCNDFDLEEIDELKSFNGTLVYKIEGENSDLIASVTFANIAKVNNGDKIIINVPNEKIEKILKIDNDLHGTIAILQTNENILNGYKYKQVKIEKVDA